MEINGYKINKLYFAMEKSKSETDAADIYFYDDIQPDGKNFFTGDDIKSETSAKALKAKLEEYGDIKRLNIHINSRGGSVFEGIAIYSLLKQHKSRKTVYIDSLAASIASVIAMAGDERQPPPAHHRSFLQRLRTVTQQSRSKTAIPL